MTSDTLAAQRAAIAAVLEPVVAPFHVIPFPRKDVVPPAIIIDAPTMNFNVARLASVTWSVRLLLPRMAAGGLSPLLDDMVGTVIEALSAMSNPTFRVTNGSPWTEEDSGFSVPGYIIYGETAINFC
jgi:hypothetical protein